MTHSDAIVLIRDGGLRVRLLLRKTNAPPPSLDGSEGNLFLSTNIFNVFSILDVKLAMGNEIEPVNNNNNNTHWKPSGLA